MQIERLNDIDYVKENMSEVLELQTLLTTQVDRIKNSIKENETDLELGNLTGVYNKYTKLIPINIEDIISAYPIEEYPDIYSIKLKKEGLEVIKDESLFIEGEVKSVTFK